VTLALYEDNGAAQYTFSRRVSPYAPVPWVARNDKGFDHHTLAKFLCNLADALLPSIISVEPVVHGHLPSIRLGRADAFEWFGIALRSCSGMGEATMGSPGGRVYRFPGVGHRVGLSGVGFRFQGREGEHCRCPCSMA
jgi:hypothetical protein